MSTIPDICYFYFRRKDYENPGNFVFPIEGFTIYCPKRNKIYRPYFMDYSDDLHIRRQDLGYLQPPLSIEDYKFVSFSNPEQIIDQYARSDITKNPHLTKDERAKALAAFERYEAHPIGSLAWPTEAEMMRGLRHFNAAGGGRIGHRPCFEVPIPEAVAETPRKPAQSVEWRVGEGLVALPPPSPQDYSTDLLPRARTNNSAAEPRRMVNVAREGEKPFWVRAPNIKPFF